MEQSVIRFVILCLSTFFSGYLSAQSKDTSLFTIYSVPYFYNVVKTPEGEIMAGTSDGMYRIKDARLQKRNSQSGYITINNKGQAVIDSNGIKYHDDKSLLHLLPYPAERRDAYHAGSGDHFYITSGGKMHVYQLMPFQILYRNHSVRTISPHFVGTYSGIYFNGKLHEFSPKFCDGYIREYHGKFFVCYSELMIWKPDTLDSSRKLQQVAKPVSPIFGEHIRDVLYSPILRKYIVQSTRSLAIMDTSLLDIKEVYSATNSQNEVVLLGEDSSRSFIVFADGPTVMALFHVNQSTQQLGQLPEQILDGYISQLNYFFLTKNALYVRRADTKFEKLLTLDRAHTLRSISPSQLVIGTDNGLFLYNIITRNLTRIIPGVEFNRRGLFVQDQKLYAGSVTGLYVLDISQLEQIALQTSTVASGTLSLPGWLLPLTVLFILLFSVVIYLMIYYRKKMQSLISEIRLSGLSEKNRITKGDIIGFINEHLTTASLHAITDHFQINNTQVYSILDPDKPGAIIQELRLQKVKQLRKEGKTAKAIAEVTGLSASYIRKIWNNFSDDGQA